MPQPSSSPTIAPLKKILPLIYHKLIIYDPVDFHLKKRIKRKMALNEKETFRKVFLTRKGVSYRRLSSRKYSSELTFHFKMSRENLKTILQFLKHQSRLKRLRLYLNDKLDQKALLKLGKMLTKFQRLTHLCFGQDNLLFSLNDDTLVNLAFILRKLPNLQEKSLHFEGNAPFKIPLDIMRFGFSLSSGTVTFNNNAQHQDDFQRRLHWLSRLRIFPFNISTQNLFTVNGLDRLRMIASSLNRLQECSLNLRNCFITHGHINKFLDVLAIVPSLTSVKVGFQVTNNISNFPLSHKIFKQNNLKKVGFDLDFSFKSDAKAMNVTLESIAETPALCELYLNLGKSTCGDDTMLKQLAEILRKLPKFRKIDLSLTHCKAISNPGVMRFLRLIGTGKALEDLQLTTTQCSFMPNPDDDSVGIEYDGFRYLKKLSLKMQNAGGLAKILARGILGIIRKSEKLQVLQLDLDGCENITCKFLKEIGEHVSLLKSLYSFTITLGNYSGKRKRKENIFEDGCTVSPDLGNDSIITLGNCLSKMESLRTVSVNFQNCRNVTEEGNIGFCQAFEKSYRIHTLCIKIPSNPEMMSQELIKALRELDQSDSNRYMVEISLYGRATCSQKIVKGI